MDPEGSAREHFQGDGLAKLACSCILGEGVSPGNKQVYSLMKSAAFVQRISGDEISFATHYPLTQGQIVNLKINPVGGSPFNCKVRVLKNVPTSDKAFHLTTASFEEITPDDQQKLANLLITISQIQKDMME